MLHHFREASQTTPSPLVNDLDTGAGVLLQFPPGEVVRNIGTEDEEKQVLGGCCLSSP